MGRPEGVGPGLEREKTGDRDRGETGPDRVAKRKIETRGFTESDSGSERERERERKTERGKQRNGGRIREEEPEERRV